MIHGDFCLYTFKEPDKRRPVLIFTGTNAISFLNGISIAPITSTTRDIETSVRLDESDGMSRVCAINLDYIQTVPKNKLGKIIAHLSEERMQEVFEAIKYAFGFEK